MPPIDPFLQARALLDLQRAERDNLQKVKVVLEQKLRDSIYLVEHFELDLE